MRHHHLAYLFFCISIASAATPQTPQPAIVTGVTAPAVYDANNALLGALVTIDDDNASGSLLFKLADLGTIISLKIRRDNAGDVVWGNPVVLYKDAGCKGDAFVRPNVGLSSVVAFVDANEDLLIGDVIADQVADKCDPSGACDQVRGLSQIDSTGQCHSFPDSGPGWAQSPAIKLHVKLSMSDYVKLPLSIDQMTGRTRLVSH